MPKQLRIQSIAKTLAHFTFNSAISPFLFCPLLVISVFQMGAIISESPLDSGTSNIPKNYHENQETGPQTYMSELSTLLRWFDPSLFILQQKYILLIIIAPVLIISMIMIAQTYLKLNKIKFPCRENNYLFRISLTICYILNYGMLPIIIRSSATLFITSLQNYMTVLVTIMLIFYILVIYCFPLFILNEVSWRSRRITAAVVFPSALVFYNLLRLVTCLIIIPINIRKRISIRESAVYDLQYPAYTLVISLISFITLFYNLARHPIISTRFNTAIHSILSMACYILLIRILQLIFLIKIQIVIIFLLGFLSHFAMRLLAQRRIFRILLIKKQNENDQHFRQKMRILCYLANHLVFKHENFCKNILDRFLIQHHRYCSKIDCKCIQLLNFSYLKTQANTQNLKSFKNFTVIRKNQDGVQSQEIIRVENNLQYIGKLREEKRLWFLFINELYEDKYSSARQEMEAMNQNEKLKYLHSMSFVGIDQSYILYEYLNKIYTSAQMLKTLKQQFDQHEFTVLHFRIQYYILLQILQAQILNNIKEFGSIKSNNKFASLQLKLIDFRTMIFKSVSTGIKFWDEMGQGIDQTDIDARVGELDQCLNRVKDEYDYLAEFYGFLNDTNQLNREIAGSSTYQKTWNLKVQKVINEFYFPFHIIFDKTVKNMEEEFLIYESLIEVKNKNVVKLMNVYDSDSKLPMCMIDINQGNDFTKICRWNTEFWKFTEYKQSPKMKICDMLIEDFVSTHTHKMSSLLKADHIELPVLHTFIKTTNHHFREVDFYGTIFLDLFEGFRFSIFWEKTRNHQRAIFLSKSSEVIGYTHELQQSVQQEETINLANLIQQIEKTHKKNPLKFNQRRCIDVCDTQVELTYFHAIRNLEDTPILKIFEVSFQNIFSKKISSNQTINENILSKEITKQIKKEKERRPSLYFEQASNFDEKIENLTEIVQNDKKCKTVTRWFCVNIVLFVCMQIAALWAIAAATVKEDFYKNIYFENKNFSELYLSMLHLSFNLRRMNILAYEKSMGYSSQNDLYSQLGYDDQVRKFQIYQKAIKSEIEKIDVLDESVDFDWSQIVDSYNFYGIAPPTYETVSLQLLKNKLLLSSAIYLSSQSIENLSFSQFFEQIPLPLPSQAQNLYNALFNNNYILLSMVKEAFEKSEFVIWGNLGIFLMAPNYSCLILILACLFIFGYSIYVINKVKNTVNISFEMLSYLNKQFVDNRKSQFQKYKNRYMSDLQLESQTKNKIMIRQSSHRALTQISKSNHNLSIKRFFQQNKSIFQQQEQNPQDTLTEKRFLKFNPIKTNHIKQYLLIKLRLLPIIVLGIFAIYYQSFSGQNIKTLMMIAHPLEQFTQNVFEMRNAIHETPFQNLNIVPKEVSLNENKEQIIDDIYKQMKELTLNLDKSILQETYLRFQKIKYAKYCEILQVIGKPLFIQNVHQSCTDNFYNDKSPDQFFVYLIQTARILSFSTEDQDDGFQHRRALYRNVNPYMFEQIGSFEYRIVEYIREGLEIDLQSISQNYFISMLEIELSIICVSSIVAIFWVRKLKKTLFSQTSKVKTIFKLISFKLMKTHPELKTKISQHFQDFDCLK